jgi:hypothetical protein
LSAVGTNGHKRESLKKYSIGKCRKCVEHVDYRYKHCKTAIRENGSFKTLRPLDNESKGPMVGVLQLHSTLRNLFRKP